MKDIRHVFFDLDRTLWDFETNSTQTLFEIYSNFHLKDLGIGSFEAFKGRYLSINEALWDDYRAERIDKTFLRYARFIQTLQMFGIEQPEIARSMGDYYVAESPKKKALFPKAAETLEALKNKYELHIITNGFEEVQHVKLSNCGLDEFFEQVITSERAGVKKPDPQIFHHALTMAKATPQESIMIGDDLKVDLFGAMDVGMKTIYFNPHNKTLSDRVNFTVSSLDEILTIL